jgi:hypothetical protein
MPISNNAIPDLARQYRFQAQRLSPIPEGLPTPAGLFHPFRGRTFITEAKYTC